MLQFQDFLSEEDEVRVRAEKTGRAVDEEVFVQVANFASKIRKNNPNITREALIKRLHKEIEAAKKDQNHKLSYNNADVEHFVKKIKKVSAGSKDSWHDQLDIAVDSLATTINHKDFTPYWNSKQGFRAFRLGNALGDLSEKWRARGLGGATRTPKTDIAFTAEGARGLFTASLKDETGGVLITSASGESGAILEHSFEDLLPHLKSSLHDAEKNFAYKQIAQIENWMGNDANAEKADKALWKLVDHFNGLGSTGEPPVPLGEHFLRNIYKEAISGEHKFKDSKSVVSHLLKLARGDKSKFQSLDEHMKPMLKPDKDGFMFFMNRSNDSRYNTNYARIGLGKHGLRGAQPAAFRVYPMKADLQKADWLKIQDDHVLKGNFDGFREEFGYAIPKDEALRHWNRRVNALSKAQRSDDYQGAVGYKITKDEVKARRAKKVPEPKNVSAPKQPVPTRPVQSSEFAGAPPGMDYNTPGEIAAYKIQPEPGEVAPRAAEANASKKVAAKVAEKQPKQGVVSKMGAMAQAAMQKVTGKKAPAAETKSKDKFDWSGVEKAYTTTNAGVEEIARAHGISAADVTSHAWSMKLRRPSRRNVA